MPDIPCEIQVVISVFEHDLKLNLRGFLLTLRKPLDLFKLLARFGDVVEDNFPIQLWHK
jgi:hypothetical protein